MNWEAILVSFLAPFLGAGVPVVLGTIFYRREKKIERQQRLHDEKRLAYSAFLSAYSDAILANGFADKEDDLDSETFGNLINCLGQVILYAPSDIADLAGNNTVFSKENNGISLRDLASKMRADLEK